MPAVSESLITPATIFAIDDAGPQVLCDGQSHYAQLAVPFGYRPSTGDSVLVARESTSSSEARCWIIGVLHAQAPFDLSVAGDLRLRAPRGSIELHARDGVHVHGRVFRVCVQLVEVISHTMRQRLASFMQHISGPWSSRCRSHQSVVDEERIEQSGRAHVRTKKEYTLNGSTIHLG